MGRSLISATVQTSVIENSTEAVCPNAPRKRTRQSASRRVSNSYKWKIEKFKLTVSLPATNCQVMLPFYMVSGHRMKAPYNTTQCSLTYRQKRNRNVPSQLSMSDMWFSICNIKIYIIKEGLIHAKLKFHSWGEIVLMQVLVTFSSSNMQTRDVFFFCCLSMSSCMAHPVAFFNFVKLL